MIALLSFAVAYPLARLLCEPKRLGQRRPGTRPQDLMRRKGAAVYLVLPAGQTASVGNWRH